MSCISAPTVGVAIVKWLARLSITSLNTFWKCHPETGIYANAPDLLDPLLMMHVPQHAAVTSGFRRLFVTPFYTQ